jgi:phosphatidylethanolamine/phosphatidyl-N-methylethanolamine N-methyltransferase
MPTDAVPADAWRAFLAAFVRRPGTMGAVAPSSARLSAVLTSIVPTAGSPVVVELGPGTGAVSAAIDQRLPAGSRHLAVELDATMVEYLGRTRPGMEVVYGDARNLGKLLAERDVTHVDAVVCGLPWALFDEPTQHAVLSEVGEAIGPTGAFSTFAYVSGMALPAARRFRRTLRSRFEEVIVSATVWRNVPPAFVYVCRRPTG